MRRPRSNVVKLQKKNVGLRDSGDEEHPNRWEVDRNDHKNEAELHCSKVRFPTEAEGVPQNVRTIKRRDWQQVEERQNQVRLHEHFEVTARTISVPFA